jgi:hypothetical protein
MVALWSPKHFDETTAEIKRIRPNQNIEDGEDKKYQT